MIDISGAAGAIAGGVAISGAFWAIRYFVPGMLARKIHSLFEDIKGGGWVRDPAHPRRIQWLTVTLELLEEEVPEPGQGADVYAKLGDFVASHVPVGSGQKWADVLQKIGDEIDLELDRSVQELKGPEAPKS